MKTTEKSLDSYLDRQRTRLGCRVGLRCTEHIGKGPIWAYGNSVILKNSSTLLLQDPLEGLKLAIIGRVSV